MWDPAFVGYVSDSHGYLTNVGSHICGNIAKFARTFMFFVLSRVALDCQDCQSD